MLESKIKKIPGRLPPIPTKDKESHIEDIKELPKSKLMELIDRQKKIAENKIFLSKLPDKGEKIKTNYEKLLNELKVREEAEASLCNLMSSLAVQKKEVEDIEWSANYNPGSSKKSRSGHSDEDSDSDDADPIKILATHSGTGFAKKEIRVEKVPESLIKESDLVVDDDSQSSQSKQTEQKKLRAKPLVRNLEEYAVHLCDKFDSKTSLSKPEKFYPHKSVISKSVNKPKVCKLESKASWEVTAATPPPPVFDNAKLVSLQESLDIQQKQAQQLKEIQMKHATERLSKMVGLPDASSLNYMDYRDEKETTSDESSDGEEQECHDEEGEPEKDVAVVYNVIG